MTSAARLDAALDLLPPELLLAGEQERQQELAPKSASPHSDAKASAQIAPARLAVLAESVAAAARLQALLDSAPAPEQPRAWSAV